MASAGAALAFVLLAVLVADWGALQRLDQRVAVHLNEYVAPHPDQVRAWQLLSDVAAPAVLRALLAVAAVVLLLYRRLRAGLLCAGAAAGSLLVVSIGKVIVDRPRPHVPHPVAAAPGASFPSGHALTSAAVALTLLALAWGGGRRRRVAVGVIAGLLAVAVGFSRMILGVHYLTDVVGGWLGAAALVLALTAAVAFIRS